MSKTIFITGSTDGIGLATAEMLLKKGHHVIIHGRSAEKIKNIEQKLNALSTDGKLESYVADLSQMVNVEKLAEQVSANNDKIDVLINNAGVFAVENSVTKDCLDVRFAVNTIAPYLLTKKLLPLLAEGGRVINLSSAAQASVNIEALAGKISLDHSSAYAQSKLALTIWSNYMAGMPDNHGTVFIAVNPKSFLGSNMVKQAYGIQGADLNIGADILSRAALSDEFADANGKYFDNDIQQFSNPHPDALDASKRQAVVDTMETILEKLN